MPSPNKSFQENVLYVEGNNDENAIRNIWKRRGLSDMQFRIESSRDNGGVGNVISKAKLQIREGVYKKVGIVVDADADIIARWIELRKILIDLPYEYALESGQKIPEVPPSNGVIAIQRRPKYSDNNADIFNTRVGIWIMPDNRLSGAIEEFIRTLVLPSDASLWKYAEKCVADLPQPTKSQHENWQAKARIHTFLAWQKQPGISLEDAIKRGVLDSNARTADPFIDWLKRLFELA